MTKQIHLAAHFPGVNNTTVWSDPDAADGYILVPHITPGGLTPFVNQVVPLLQERGLFRADYTGTTLRDHLGLDPVTPIGDDALPARAVAATG